MANLTCPTPENISPLRPGAYQFSIFKLPNISYFVTSTQVPAITLGVATQPTSVHDIKIPGEQMDYQELTVQFQVDEQLKNWNAIYFWMFGLGYPEGHEIYKQYLNADINDFSTTELSKGYSDGQLIILNSANNPIQQFQFVDMFPISLQGLDFDSADTNHGAVTATVTFAYSYFKVINKDINNH